MHNLGNNRFDDIGSCVVEFMRNLRNGSVPESGHYAGMGNLFEFQVKEIVEQLIEDGSIVRRDGRLARVEKINYDNIVRSQILDFDPLELIANSAEWAAAQDGAAVMRTSDRAGGKVTTHYMVASVPRDDGRVVLLAEHSQWTGDDGRWAGCFYDQFTPGLLKLNSYEELVRYLETTGALVVER